MADLNQLVTPSLGAIIVALGVACLVLLVVVLVLVRRTSRLERRLSSLTRAGDGKSLEEMLEAHLDKVYAVARELEELKGRTVVLEREEQGAFQRLGLVRYNPFEDTGGNQSFALALLNDHGDGFVVSSLHTRTATRVYGKAISKGRSEGALSNEEQEALRIALATGRDRRKADPMRPVTPELARARPRIASCLLSDAFPATPITTLTPTTPSSGARWLA